MTSKPASALAVCLLALVGVALPIVAEAAPPFTSKSTSTSNKPSQQASNASFSLGPNDHFAPDDELSNPYLTEETPLADDIQLVNELTTEDAATSQIQYQQALGGNVQRANTCNSGHRSYQWRLLPQGVIYRSYLAGVKESRFRSVWNNQKDNGDNWDISLGGRATLVRYGTGGDLRPEGFEIGIEGAGLTRLDPEEDHDVAATDYRFGIPVTWGDSFQQFKVAYYHLSSHVGDEFILKNPGFNRLNYSRDVFVLGYSIYPRENLRFYGEMGYGFRYEVAEPWEFQFGLDYAPTRATGFRGAPFVAFNGHLREEVDFGGNFVAQTGWAWRRSAASGLFRLGVEYYNGKDDQFSLYNNSVQKTGFGIWYDY